MQDLGAYVRSARQAKGIKASELAQMVGQVPSWVSKLETGKAVNYPSPEEIKALSEALDVSPAKLLAQAGYFWTDRQLDEYEEALRDISSVYSLAIPSAKSVFWKLLTDASAEDLGVSEVDKAKIEDRINRVVDDPRELLAERIRRIELRDDDLFIMNSNLDAWERRNKREREGKA